MTAENRNKYSFRRGWAQVRNCDVRQCRADIMTALGLVTRMAFLQRLNGNVEPRISEYKAIEAVFAKYGITDIWGAE